MISKSLVDYATDPGGDDRHRRQRSTAREHLKSYLTDKPELPPHRDNNAQWDDEDDWPKKK